MTEIEDFDVKLLNTLVALAKRKIAGTPVAGKEILSALESVCEKNVSTLPFKQSLKNVDLNHALIIGAWLEWYVIYLKTERISVSENVENFTKPIQVVFLGGFISLVFVSNSLEDIEISVFLIGQIILLIGFIFSSIVRIFTHGFMKIKQLKQEIASSFLESIKAIKS